METRQTDSASTLDEKKKKKKKKKGTDESTIENYGHTLVFHYSRAW